MEALSKPETVVFDKTGTLTKGSFTVTRISPVNVSESELLKNIALAESYSNHPIAVSIKEAYGKAANNNEVKDIEEIAGNGIRAIVNGNEILAGNSRLKQMLNIDYTKTEDSGTVVYTSQNGS
ncbi:MAG: HAD family hydrolase, partial [Candidatus Gastranaerophilaceae bacterium]